MSLPTQVFFQSVVSSLCKGDFDPAAVNRRLLAIIPGASITLTSTSVTASIGANSLTAQIPEGSKVRS